MASRFKVESGLQLLARLRKKPENETFYPGLFQNGLKHGEVVELYSEDNLSYLLIDIITETLIPETLGGIQSGVLLVNTDGNLNFDTLVNILNKKLTRLALESNKDVNTMTHEVLKNFFIIDVYDGNQLHMTIHKLETILMDNPDISLLLFHTLTAFYWSEQGFKITKMDIYLKNLLRMVQKITKEYNIKIMFTRPDYFSSSKECIENLEACSRYPTLECVNYRIQVVHKEDDKYLVNVQTSDKLYKRFYKTTDNKINWI